MRIPITTSLFILAVALLVTNTVGLLVAPARHPLALEPIQHKQGLRLLPADEARTTLTALAPSHTGDFLTRSTEIVASGIRHYWPNEHEYDSHAALQFHENWLVAALGWGERLLFSAGALGEYRFARLERLGYDRILSKGVGFCSQVSRALASYLAEVGVDARLVGLDGHVVVASRADGQEYLLDPDYNVVIRASLQEVENAPELAARAYTAAGYSAELAQQLATFYGADGNFVGGVDTYHPRQRFLRRALDALKWGLPVVVIMLVLVARRSSRTAHTLRTHRGRNSVGQTSTVSLLSGESFLGTASSVSPSVGETQSERACRAWPSPTASR